MPLLKSKPDSQDEIKPTVRIDNTHAGIQLALLSGANPATVQALLNSHVMKPWQNCQPRNAKGGRSRMGRKRRVDLDVANIIEMRKAGKSLGEIAKFYRTSKRTVGRIVCGQRN